MPSVYNDPKIKRRRTIALLLWGSVALIAIFPPSAFVIVPLAVYAWVKRPRPASPRRDLFLERNNDIGSKW